MRRRRMHSNRRHHARRSSTRLVMNKLMRSGSEIAKDVLMPIGVGGAGFVAARALSNLDMVESKLGSNAKIVAPLVGVVATLALAKPLKLSTVNRNFLALGMGVVAVDALMKKVAPGFMADRVVTTPTSSGTDFSSALPTPSFFEAESLCAPLDCA